MQQNQPVKSSNVRFYATLPLTAPIFIASVITGGLGFNAAAHSCERNALYIAGVNSDTSIPEFK